MCVGVCVSVFQRSDAFLHMSYMMQQQSFVQAYDAVHAVIISACIVSVRISTKEIVVKLSELPSFELGNQNTDTLI